MRRTGGTERFAILVEGSVGPLSSKTANACIRYTPDRVVALIDSSRAGARAQDVLGFGGGIPVVGGLEDALALGPTALLIGIAPVGGRLPDAWREIVRRAIARGLDVWSGLHAFLGDDEEFVTLSRRHGTAIVDLRRPPPSLTVASGRVRDIAATVVLSVGSDCNIGKMTAQLQIRDALAARGPRVSFAATGQTGILVEGWGIAVDAVVADFIAGAAEQLVVEAAAGADIVLVEGQGSILHPGYSGVTYGLMHGSLPHAFLLCTQPSRRTIRNNDWVAIPSIAELVRLHEAAAAPLRPAPVIALALNTFDLPDDEARREIERASSSTGLPATDPVRYDPAPLADAIHRFHLARLGR